MVEQVDTNKKLDGHSVDYSRISESLRSYFYYIFIIIYLFIYLILGYRSNRSVRQTEYEREQQWRRQQNIQTLHNPVFEANCIIHNT